MKPYYVNANGTIIPVIPSQDLILESLPAGIYASKYSPFSGGWNLILQVFKTDGLVDLPDSVSDLIIREADDFFKEETRQAFQRYGLLYKRGFLMYGQPGTGKSCLVAKIMNLMVAKHGIVLWNPEPERLLSLVGTIRTIEPARQIMIVWEELDSILRGSEEILLSILDGELNIDNVVYVATTNYIDQIPDRIKNRPSRFATVVEIPAPDYQSRLQYLEAKLSLESGLDLSQWAKLTEGFTIDHLKDLIVSVLCLKLPLEIAVSRIRALPGAVLKVKKSRTSKLTDLMNERVSLGDLAWDLALPEDDDDSR